MEPQEHVQDKDDELTDLKALLLCDVLHFVQGVPEKALHWYRPQF